MSKKTMALFLAASLVLILACDNGDPAGNGTTPGDVDAAIARVEVANDSLSAVLFDMINADSITAPDEIDFSAANALYKEALVLDPNNLDANFGAGLTELLGLFVDAEFNATFDDWKAFIDTAVIFEPDLGGPLVNFSSPEELFSLSPEFLGLYSAGIFKMALADPPTISSIQNIVETEVFPRVEYAIEKLNTVTGTSSYTFTVTPQMQGDNLEDPIEIDMTEIYVALTELYLLKAAGNLFISYNFDVPSYDSLGLEYMISQTSPFLSLKAGGAQSMVDVKTSFLAAVTNLELAINFLEAETDNQNDDLIRIGGVDGIAQADLDTVQIELQDARDAMNGGTYTFVEDFNGDSLDQSVDFALAALFDNPLSNFKTVFPAYTSRVESDSAIYFEYQWHPDSGWIQVEVTRYFYTGVITWQAATYSQWILPNPTINGLLPGMTDSQFKTTFGIIEADWTQEMRINFD